MGEQINVILLKKIEIKINKVTLPDIGHRWFGKFLAIVALDVVTVWSQYTNTISSQQNGLICQYL